ncbi:hypothetical protein MJO28_012705 [Puccinia striiformis f. sp. tritici]|uniref:Uncharacterized protein n=1 Tax=Puccinia striiformis f. sp. tritici TaxID=168172 RepID=A0ACC0E3N2_9BASI|nr:hypothetical protein MJO28_012705 [Puccinia striiformis f. sp. tritici]KAI9621611.1 hypothetical protein H4Q26_015619 [Puccinia striiformis f. sp. tritici PST-130]
MAEPASQPSDGLEHEQPREPIVVAIEKFTILRGRTYHPQMHTDRGSLETALSNLSISENRCKELIMWTLEYQCLPTLQHQLATLERSLSPSGLQKDSESKLKPISQTQSELEDNIIWTNLLERLNLSPEESKSQTNTRFGGEHFVEEAVRVVQCAIECINGSELDVAQNSWKDDLEAIDDTLEELECFLKSENSFTSSGDHEETRKSLSPLAIPIVKLSRLFFIKLSKRHMNRKRLPSSTDMCSEQIESLARSARYVAGELLRFKLLFTRSEMGERAAVRYEFIQIIQDLQARFEPPLLVVLLYIIPSIPGDTDGFPVQTYYRTWFSTWNTQRVLATAKFIKLARLLDDDPP